MEEEKVDFRLSLITPITSGAQYNIQPCQTGGAEFCEHCTAWINFWFAWIEGMFCEAL